MSNKLCFLQQNIHFLLFFFRRKQKRNEVQILGLSQVSIAPKKILGFGRRSFATRVHAQSDWSVGELSWDIHPCAPSCPERRPHNFSMESAPCGNFVASTALLTFLGPSYSEVPQTEAFLILKKQERNCISALSAP